MMLRAYLDETGHSKDELQKFNGMAGLMTTAENWEVFEREWKRVLKRFKLPYIHMKERKTLLAGWSQSRIHDLSGQLWKIIRDGKALPIGSIIPMDDFRPLEEQLRRYVGDPYFLAMQNCIALATVSVMPGPFATPFARISMIFDCQAEFKNEATRMYSAAIKLYEVAPRVDPPAFGDMRTVVPLQAADLVAYEIYKEYDRVYYGRNRNKRWPYVQIEELYKWFEVPELPGMELVMRHTKASLADIVAKGEQQDRTAKYWEKKRTKKRDKS